jgi:hypothetical protein
MKRILYLFIFLISIASCRPVRKVQRIDEAISKKDTAQTVVINNVNKPLKVDSAKIGKSLLQKVLANKIDFNTFSAKVKIEYQDKEGGDQGTANIRIAKDSIIWVQVTGPFGAEGFRLMVTPDSVVLMNKLKKTVQYRTIGYLQELTQIPFDFATLQDFIVGNPIFLDSNVASYRIKESETWLLMIGNVFKHLLTVDANNNVVHSKLDDVDAVRNRTGDISFSAFETLNGLPFATKRSITVSENGKLDLTMDFKQYKLNEPLTYPFTIPKNFKTK